MARIRWGMVRGGEAGDEDAVRRGFWAKLRANLHRVPFAEDAVAAYYSMIDPATPARTKAILAGALAYFILPVDLIPDALVAVGFTDDVAVLMAALNSVRDSLTPGHYERARAVLQAQRGDMAAQAGAAAHPSP